MNSKNNAISADISFNSKKDENIIFDNEVKVKFMKYKSKNVAFHNEKETFPQFTSFPEKQNIESTSEHSQGFPKLKQKLFNGLTDSNGSYYYPEFKCENNNVNSNLFTNKK